ncbi:MAG: BMP family ABC transporter substrate-binding protein, partial [Mesorhizobium sp.]
ADFSRVMREYAQGGYELVLGDAFAAERESRRTAKQFPKTAWLFGSGAGPAEPNFGVFDNWIHEPAYLSGLIARMAKGGSHLAPYHKFDKTLPADVKELVEKKKAEILEGNFRVDVDENTPVSD